MEKQHVRRGIYAGALSAIVLALSGFMCFEIFVTRPAAVAEARTLAEEQNVAVKRGVSALHSRMLRANSVPEWEALLEDAMKYGKSAPLFVKTARGKLFEARALQRDTVLAYAKRLLQKDENDPYGFRYFADAIVLHEANMQHAASLPERAGDCVWNSVLWHQIGIEYYRSLIFLAPREKSKAQDAIDQAIRAFSRIFTCYPKDRDAEVAIEMLYNEHRARQGRNDNDSSRQIQLQLMPQKALRPREHRQGVGGAEQYKGVH